MCWEGVVVSDQDTQGAHRQLRQSGLSAWHILLLVSFVATLWAPFYNSVEPRILGFPFFYAYQLAWVLLGAVLTAVVYLKTGR